MHSYDPCCFCHNCSEKEQELQKNAQQEEKLRRKELKFRQENLQLQTIK